MSVYNNFLADFATRCEDILNLFEGDARAAGREVTLLLCLAAAGFVIPFERLRPDNKVLFTRDRQRFADSFRQWEGFLSQSFVDLPFADDTSWFFGPLKDPSGDPDTWAELSNPQPVHRSRRASRLLGHMRHALAHGNVYARSVDGQNVDLLVFVARTRPHDTDNYFYLAVGPREFSQFLKGWFGFLGTLPMPREFLSADGAA